MPLVRHRERRRGARRGGGLSGPGVPRDLLRPLVDRTLAVVRADARARPPIPAPASLAPLLHFRHLASKAVETVVAALDHDPELRERIRERLTEREIGRVGWLWLTRPEGWDTELSAALGELAGDDGAPSALDIGSEGQLRRRLAGAERAAARSEELRSRAEAELARLRDEHVALVAAHDQLRAALDPARADATAAREERARAVGDLKATEKRLAARDEERAVLRARVVELEAALADASARAARAALAAEAAPATATGGVDPAVLAGLADRVERAIGDAALALDALRSGAGIEVREAAALAPAVAPAPPRRRPLGMPRGLTDDSVQAAQWLLTERPALLVDGYNVSMAAWPDADIAAQRTRLVRLLTDLAARSPGLLVEIVFDGDDVAAGAPALPARAGVNVRFTPPDVEADDELLAMIGRFPVTRPVVVASSDRRVRDGARRRGANVLSAHQLLAAARG